MLQCLCTQLCINKVLTMHYILKLQTLHCLCHLYPDHGPSAPLTQVFQKCTMKEVGSRAVLQLSASELQSTEIDPKVKNET